MALLAPEALDFGDGHAGNPEVGKGFTDFVEFEGLDDGNDVLHGKLPVGCFSLKNGCSSSAGINAKSVPKRENAWFLKKRADAPETCMDLGRGLHQKGACGITTAQ